MKFTSLTTVIVTAAAMGGTVIASDSVSQPSNQPVDTTSTTGTTDPKNGHDFGINCQTIGLTGTLLCLCNALTTMGTSPSIEGFIGCI
ncbi:hypothetical protein BDR03DRAFT_965960 [Suillus americanus]|nr:hypothetical protein BDR03DRAFT_965960 [Suillus americanus]